MKRNELTKIYIYGHNPAWKGTQHINSEAHVNRALNGDEEAFQGGREALKSDEKAFNCHEEALKGDTNASRASKSP